MLIPAVRAALRDSTLEGTPIKVYLYLLEELDPHEWRQVKRRSVQVGVGRSRRSVRMALNLLVDHGYLRRQPDPNGRANYYRLVWAVGAVGGSQITPLRAS